MERPRASTAVDCNECGKTIGRKADLARHMRTHATNKEELMHACPYLGCTYKTLQRSNLATHLNVHSRERPNKCPAAGCDFSSSDPGSLTRHRKEIHGYKPKPSSVNHPTTVARKAARQQRRISPYTTSSLTSSSSSGRSVSPLDPFSGMYYSPRPRMPQMLDLSPPSSLSLNDGPIEEDVKNTSAAYSTELITKLPQAKDSTPTPNPDHGNSLSLSLGLSTAPEAPTVEHLQFPVPEQGNLYAVSSYAQPISQMTPCEVTDEMFEKFLAQFGGTPAEPAPTYTASSPLAPPAQYNLPMLTPVSFPSYEVSYSTDNTPHGYLTEPVSFGAKFSLPCSFAAPGIGIYPQVVDQTYLYTAPTATSSFPMHGLYLH